tara:strand:- start:694 stop:1212 length:519 start_codon:yes stop_codon:yes gene_type:complete
MNDNKIVTALQTEIRNTIKSVITADNKWVKCAEMGLSMYGTENGNLFVAANSPMARARILNKGFSGEDIRDWKKDLKSLRETVEGIAKDLKHSNPRQCWKRMFEKMVELSGLDPAYFPSLVKNSTPADKCATALRTLSKYVDDTEFSTEIKEQIHALLADAELEGILTSKKM